MARANHVFNILNDLHERKFDYSRVDQILHDKNILLLSLSLVSDDIIEQINAARLCCWSIDDEPLKHCLIKLIQYNGIKNLVSSIHIQMVHLNLHVKDESARKEFMDDLDATIITLTKIVTSNKHNYSINTHIPVLKVLVSNILSTSFWLSTACQIMLWYLIGHMLGSFNINVDKFAYEANKHPLDWSIVAKIEHTLIQKFTDSPNCPFFMYLLYERAGSVIYGLWYNRCRIHDKPINIELFLVTLNILQINIDANHWDSVKYLLSIVFIITKFDVSKYRSYISMEDMEDTNKLQQYIGLIQKSELCSYVHVVINVVIKTFVDLVDSDCCNAALGVVRNMLHYNTSFVFQKQYSINNNIILEAIVKYLQHKELEIVQTALHCVSIIYRQSEKVYKEYLAANQLTLMKYASKINQLLLKKPKMTSVWIGYIYSMMETMKIRSLKLRCDIVTRLKTIQMEYLIFCSSQPMPRSEMMEYLEIAARARLLENDLLKKCCFNCCRKNKNKYKCKRCHLVKYCGRKCQKKHWKLFHKHYCSI